MAAGKSLQECFEEYASFGNPGKKNDITSKNFAKMIKDSNLMDKKINSTEVDMIFSKAKGGPSFKVLTFAKFQAALAMMAKSKYGKDDEEHLNKIKAKICAGEGPSKSGTTGTVNVSNVKRMTDSSKYTGSHKERFDETGKGKGLDGRKDMTENKGYVGNYKGDKTYDETHK